MPEYSPPNTLTSRIVNLVAEIEDLLGRQVQHSGSDRNVRLRRINRIRTITGSLAIEGNSLDEAQVTALLAGKRVLADRVPALMADLFDWLDRSDDHPLISSSVFHYEFEFNHPFSDGNGRIGRLWQSVILAARNRTPVRVSIESILFENQSAYSEAIRSSTDESDAASFIDFMLRMILAALRGTTSRSPQTSYLCSV